MTVGLLKRRVNLRSVLYVLLGSLAMNIVGCLLFSFLLARATDLFADEQHLSFVRALAESKARAQPAVTFMRAVPGNALICISIHFGISARDMLGKLAALHFPLTVYTVAGFEHGVGSLVPLFVGAMYGADADLWRAAWANLAPALVGNLVGRAAVGAAELLLFSWTAAWATPTSSTTTRTTRATRSGTPAPRTPGSRWRRGWRGSVDRPPPPCGPTSQGGICPSRRTATCSEEPRAEHCGRMKWVLGGRGRGGAVGAGPGEVGQFMLCRHSAK